MSDPADNTPQIAQVDLEDGDAAIAFVEFFINRPKPVKIEVSKTGNVYTGEVTVLVSAAPAAQQ